MRVLIQFSLQPMKREHRNWSSVLKERRVEGKVNFIHIKSMPSSIKVHSKPTWLISFFILFSLSSSDPRTSEAGLYCSPAKSTDKNFVPVFVKEMEFLSQLVTLNLWGSHFVNSTPPMYGLAQCHQDLSHLDCLLCYAAGRTKLPRCLPATSARIYLDGCFLRYDNYSFFSESVDPDHDTVNCSSGSGAIVDQVAKLEFVKNVHRVINNVTATAVANGGYGVAVVEGGAVGVYALAECWKTVNSSGCRACLQKASNEVRGCLPGKEGRGLNAGCYLRYSTEKFYDNGGESEGGSGKFPSEVLFSHEFVLWIELSWALLVWLLLILCSWVSFLCWISNSIPLFLIPESPPFSIFYVSCLNWGKIYKIDYFVYSFALLISAYSFLKAVNYSIALFSFLKPVWGFFYYNGFSIPFHHFSYDVILYCQTES